VLNPLRLTDTPSADLVGSFIMLAAVCGLYVCVAHLVFHCIRLCAKRVDPAISADAGGDLDGDMAASITTEKLVADRIFRAKLFLLYPRLPVIIATLLLPGIVLESCSLLYGELMGAAAGWEKFLGALGLVASLAFLLHHHVLGKLAKSEACTTRPLVHTSSSRSAAVRSAYIPDDVPTAADFSDGASGSATGCATPPNHEDEPLMIDFAPMSGSRSQQYWAGPESIGSRSFTSSRSRDGTSLQQIPPHPEQNLPGACSMSLRSASGHPQGRTIRAVSLLSHVPLDLDSSDPFRRRPSAGQDGEWEFTHIGPLPDAPVESDSGSGQMAVGNTGVSSSGSGQIAFPPTAEESAKGGLNNSAASGSGMGIPVTSTPREAAIPDPALEPWFTWYSPEERAQQPWVVRVSLMAAGHWSAYVARSMYCVVTPSRPGVVPWMGPHNAWRLFLVSAVAAVSPSNRDHCVYVQAMVAAICFVHGLLIYATRVFRIPALNPLQGTQSILLGLLACAPFIASADAQGAFGNTLMALSLVTVILSGLAILLEWRVGRIRGRSMDMNN
jgi:hypothetical protein